MNFPSFLSDVFAPKQNTQVLFAVKAKTNVYIAFENEKF
jgi:hypothetical protein